MQNTGRNEISLLEAARAVVSEADALQDPSASQEEMLEVIEHVEALAEQQGEGPKTLYAMQCMACLYFS